MQQSIDHFIGGRLRERRVSLNLSQQQMGALTGLSQQGYSRVERGEVPIRAAHLWLWSELMETPIEWFYPEPGSIH